MYGRKPESKERANKYRLSESGKRSSQKARLRAKESGYQKKYAKEKWNKIPNNVEEIVEFLKREIYGD